MSSYKYIAHRLRLKIVNLLTPLAWNIHYSLAALSGFSSLKKSTHKRLGYSPNLRHPKSFNERTQHKKLFNRDPLLPIASDKYKVREYVIDTLGEGAEEYLVPMIDSAVLPEKIDYKNLPSECVIKANHAAGTNLILREGHNLTADDIIKKCYQWLSRPYGLSKFQWAYTKIKKRIIVEELLKTDTGDIPEDYKFHILNGKCIFIQVDYERHGENRTRTHYDTDWNVLPFSMQRYGSSQVTDAPKRLKEMIELSIKLAKPFEYSRIDWYAVNDRIYLGEITQYPGDGISPFEPDSVDFKLGQLWDTDTTIHDVLS
ncbi:ATP-grasp fold amidoligase family protein [Reinekea thalattae]|uniref:Teichuronopeptide biosynthesis TupA-like protein n=1 Tax=Reinekea thalattae TaxID=2593301 RepID=A0A5C8Z9X3_9GAMM|nr:ATP-grasp fold amidoligase family protein [Reinekea thalattae]TXR53961.1 hypothetical protein FME95_05270 [Reinekea thalattae]